MAFVSTLGKVSSNHRAPVARLRRLRLAGMGDLGKPAARSVGRSLPTIRWSLRGLGETTCTIDPTTGGRVCSSGPATAAVAAPASTGTATPRYLPDPTVQQWAWNNPMKASWIFTGRDSVNSAYDMYMRQDGQAFAAVGPGGGFMYDDPRRATVPAYGPLTPAATPAPVPTPVTTPATTNQVIDASTGQPLTIQPVTPSSALPSNYVSTSAPATFPSSGSGTPWGTYALYGGIAIGGLLVLKMLGVIKK